MKMFSVCFYGMISLYTLCIFTIEDGKRVEKSVSVNTELVNNGDKQVLVWIRSCFYFG